MGRSILCLLLVCYFAACIAERASLPGCDLTNEGNEFFVGFFRNRFGRTSEQEDIDPVLWITTSESTPVSFEVSTIFGLLARDVATRGEITYIDIPIGFVVSDSALGSDEQFKGIRIKAANDSRIAVFGHNEEQASNDAYLGLPIISLPAGRSYEYIAASIFGDAGTVQEDKDSVALIIGTENDTEIIVEHSSTNPVLITYDETSNSLFFPGSPINLRTVTIQRFQTFYLQVSGGDISGTRIIANKPVSVFSGHECANVPLRSEPCDILIEQLQPIDTWGTEAVTVPLSTRSGDLLKVFASQDSTTVNVTYTDLNSGTVTTTSFTLNRNGFQELGGTSTVATGAIDDFAKIQSNNPIAVFQFSRSFSTDRVIVSDPFMLTVPSCEQYRDSYAVAPAPFNETTIGNVATRVAYVNYTNIAVPAEYFNASLITINNSPANASEFRPIRRADNSIWGYGAQLLLDEGAQVIRHEDPNAALSVTIYGLSNQQSWGTIGGTGLAPVALSVVSIDESTGAPGVAINILEGAGVLEVVLVLSKAVGQEVSVFLLTINGSAEAGVDFGPSENYTVTFPAGSTRQSVEIPIIDNNVYELNRDFQFRLNVPEVAVRAGVIDGCDPFTDGRSVQIIDDDPITVMFSETMYSVIEGTGPAQPVLVLSNPSSFEFSVNVTNTDGSATGGGVDYGSGPYTVTFPAGMTSVPFDIPITDDIIFEGNESFTLTIDPSLPTFVSVGTPDEATVTIVDDDPLIVSFEQPTYSVNESAGPAPPVLVLSNPSATPFDVMVTNTDGSATGGGVDYGSGPYTVTFPAGIMRVPFEIPITDDSVYEGDEDFVLTIDSSSLPTGGSVGDPGQATVTILDDDPITVMFNQTMYSVIEDAGPARPVLVLSNPSSFEFSVNVTNTDGSATGGGEDYGSGPYTVTFPAGMTSVPFDIPITDDVIQEGNENFMLTIDPSLPTYVSVGDPSEATVTIVDNDVITVMFDQTTYSVDEDSGPAQPVLVLSNPSTMTITVMVTNTDGSATGGGVDYGSGPYTVTFSAGMTSVPFDIPITDDIVFEGNENFTLTIDPSLPTGVSVGTPDEATVTIVDDDPITVMFSETMYSVDENAGPAQPVLVLSNPSSTSIDVTVTNTDGSATGGGVDYGSGPYTVTFPAGMTSVPFDIPITDDIVYEGDENFLLTIDPSLPTGVSVGTPSQATVTIVDDDPITVMFSQTMYSVIEGAGPAQPVLVLSNPSSFEFSVNVTNTDGSATGGGVDYGSGPYTVTFPAGMTSVPFDIPITDDVIQEGNENFTLTIDPSLPTYVSVGDPSEAAVTIVDNDVITVMFDQTIYSVDEDSGPAQPVLVLSNPSTMTITVTVTNTDGSATGGVDYGSGPYTVTFSAGVTSVPFDIPITDDIIFEGNENFTLTIDPSLPTGVSVGTPDEATVTIVDDDPITVMFNQTMYSVDESAGPAQPVLVLSNPSSTSFDVTVTNTDGSATGGGEDYGSGPYTVTFPAGVTSVPFDIPITDDIVYEGDENFLLTIDPSLPTGVSVGTPSQATVTIVDDDPITVMFNQTMYSVIEGTGPAQPVLVLSNPSSFEFSVNVTNTDGSATGGGVDYGSGPYTVTFPAGMTSVPFDIPITDDVIQEGNENFMLTIDPSLPTYVSVGDPGEATVTIVDNDRINVMFERPMYSVDEDSGPAQPVLILSNPSSMAFNVTVTNTDGSATGAGVDYGSGPYIVTFLAGMTSVPFDVPITDDVIQEGNENFTLTIDPSLPTGIFVGSPDQATVTIVDNDAITVMFSETTYSVDEDNGPAQPVLVLSNPSSMDITVQVRDDDDTATSGDDYGPGIYTVVIPAGMTMAPFNISIVDDDILEGDEDFDIVIVQPTLPDGVTRGDPGRATVTIVDNDPITVMFNETMYSVDEDAGPAQPVLVLSNPSATPFDVTVTDTSGSATGGVDYGSGPYTVTFPAGVTSVPFDIPIIDDMIQEGTEDFRVTISSSSLPDDVSVGSPDEATVTILDDDSVMVMFSNRTYSVDEDGGPAQPVLVLNIPSSMDITVQVRDASGTATSGDDYGPGIYSVVIPAGMTMVPFDISIVDDDILEGDENFDIVIVPGTLPDGVTRGDPGIATVTIVDDDSITVMFSETTYSVDEDNGPAQPVLVLSNPSSMNITVQVRDDDDTATSGDDYGPGIYTVVIPAGMTMVPFNISIVDDNILEGDEDFDIVIVQPTLPDGVTRGDPGRATVTIVDNDPITVAFSNRTYSVDEDDGPAQPVLVLSNPSSTDITVQVRDDDDTATSGDDYGPGIYTVVIPAGMTMVPFDISIVDDSILEGDEDFDIVIVPGTLPDDVTRGAPGRATVTIVDDDSITVMFDQTMYSVDEDSGPAQPVLVLSGTSSMDIMVTVTDTEGSATGGGVDYGSGPYTVTIPAGMTSVPFDIPIINDMILENNENFTITIDPSLPTGVSVGTPDQATVTIVDEDTVTVRFANRTGTVSEPDGFVILTVVKEGDADVPVTVTVTTSDGTAIAGDDYQSTTTTVTIPAGQTSVDVPVSIIDDNCREEDETFNGELTVAPGQPSVILGTPDQTIITIVDDDESNVQFINSPYFVEEGIGIYNVCLSISPACPLGATVTLVPTPKVPVDAEPGSDYEPDPTTVTFAPNQRIACVEMNNIIDDNVLEGTECFSLVITVPPGSGLVPGDSANVTITDNDQGVNVRFFNDTIIGDPLYEVPLNMISNETFPEVTSLCYEIHGEAGQIFNLISDGCVQVNANYSAMDIPENGNIISQIGVLAYDNAGGCAFIMVDVSDCVPVVNGIRYDTTVYNMSGVTARRRSNRARITVPNCAGEADDLVFWVVCQEFNNQSMIKFQVLRGSGLLPDSHGLLGQFWNIPVTATGPLTSSPFNDSDAYSVVVDPPQSPARSFVAELYRRTWERALKPCLYAGNSQGGPISEVSNDASIIEGEYFEYEVTDGLFGTSFTYNRLQARPCPRQ